MCRKLKFLFIWKQACPRLYNGNVTEQTGNAIGAKMISDLRHSTDRLAPIGTIGKWSQQKLQKD